MQNRISYYILSLLHLHGSVRIPGLGRFVRDRQSARTDEAFGKVFPPQTSGSFAPGSSGNGVLLEKYVAYRDNVTRTQARRSIIRFSAEVRSALEAEGLANLESLGELKQKGDVIWFDPDLHFINPGHSALPVVSLPPALRSMSPTVSVQESPLESAVPVEQAEKQLTVPEKPREERYVAPVIPISRSAAEPQVRDRVEKKADNGTERSVKKPFLKWLIPLAACLVIALAVSLFLLFRAKPEPVVAEVAPVESTDLPERNTPYKERSTLNEETANEELPVAYADTGSNAETNEEITEQEETQVEERLIPEQAIEEVVSAPTSESAAAYSGCMIVTGAFSRTLNADRMAQRLQAMGYQVRTIQNGNLAQVGVPVQCDGEDIQALVETLRTNIEPGSWLLRPAQ